MHSAQQYQAEAEQGGFHYGNYGKTGSGTCQLGPVHISGDLKLTGSIGIELQGTVYVDGKIRMSGSSYVVGPSTLVAEGDITVTGSGHLDPDELPVIMSVYGDIQCSGSSETSAVLYAPNAEVELVGSASVYGAVVGYSVGTTGSSVISYPIELRDREDLPCDPHGGSPEILTYTIE